jgi:hypothetical protein
MPKGPRGEKRSGDVIGGDIVVGPIGAGQVEDARTRVSTRRAPDAIDERIARFAGTGNRRHSTGELMAMLRSDA